MQLALILASALISLPITSLAATAPEVVTFPAATNSAPGHITLGPDGNFWFTDTGIPAISRITPSRTITNFTTGLGTGSHPNGITAGPDGNLWFADSGTTPAIGKINPTTGAITEFSSGLPAPSAPTGISRGPDGNLWFTDATADAVGRITTGGTITEFSLAAANLLVPNGIMAGPDGNLWFAASGTNSPTQTAGIGKITTAGVVTSFPLPPGFSPQEITTGPDGNLWATDMGFPGEELGPDIDQITTAGVITKFNRGFPIRGDVLHGLLGLPVGIAAGPDGNLWFADKNVPAIGRITPSGVITEFASPVPTAEFPSYVAFSASGTLFFTSNSGTPPGNIGASSLPSDTLSVTLSGPGIGEVTSVPSGTPLGIICGEGNAACAANFNDATTVTLTATAAPGSSFQGWSGAGATAGGCSTTAACAVPLTGNQDSAITASFQTVPASAKLTVAVANSGTVTSAPSGISCGVTCMASFNLGEAVTLTATPAASSYFVGWTGGGCTGIAPCTLTLAADTSVTASFVPQSLSDVVLAAAVLPGSRSVEVGSTATVFGTMINASADTTGVICAVQPATSIPAGFTFQATNAQNQPIAPLNAAVPIAPGAPQPFILALTPTASFAPTQVALSFSCDNAVAPAGTLIGINTLLFSASTTPVPDIVALAATESNDGIVDIPGTSGTGAFAIASINLGTTDTFKVSPNFGSANLPVTLSICETLPSGQCMTGPGQSVFTPIAPNDTPTFSVFAQANGAVPFQPATNRIFVQFTDSNGVNRGQTSVAVRTH